MHRYEIIIYWSQDDHVFIAEVPELPGCIAYGNSQEAALKNVHEAVQLWIDTAKEFGDPVPEPKEQRLMLVQQGAAADTLPRNNGVGP
jgi:predicted RNase H-like HicB family nuclease